MNTANPAPKRDLPDSDPTGMSPKRKTNLKDNSMQQDSENEDEDDETMTQEYTPPPPITSVSTSRRTRSKARTDKDLERINNTPRATSQTQKRLETRIRTPARGQRYKLNW